MIIPSSLHLFLLLLLCHLGSASRLAMKQYGDGIDPIAATQPTLPFPGGPTQIPSMPVLPNFPSFQQPITNNPPHYNLPPPPPSPPPPSTNPNSGASAAVIGGERGVGSNIPSGLPAYPSMPSYIPKFPPFPFIPTMPSLPSLPLPHFLPDSGSSSSTQSSLSSLSPPACTDKPHAGQPRH